MLKSLLRAQEKKEVTMKFYLWKQLASAILFLVLLMVPFLSARAEDPWEVLEGFSLVPGSEARLEEHYVAALYENLEEKMLAIVVFNADCDLENCMVNRRAAYTVFNDEGINVHRYIDPREQELMILIFGGPFV